MKKETVLILADDLTGAVDTSACFSRYGVSVTVSIDGTIVSEPNQLCSAVNMSTREQTPDRAYAAFLRLGRVIERQDDCLVIKKTDMGLRGNHGAEIAGLLEGTGAEVCWFVNALPVYQTYVLEGLQYVKGKLLTESMYLQDPSRKPETASIARILFGQTDLQVGLVSLEAVRMGRLRADAERLVQSGCRIIVFDCIDAEDCQKILQETRALPYRALWAGTLGLLDAVAELILPEAVPISLPLFSGGFRCLCFSASQYDSVERQIAFAERYGLQRMKLSIDICLAGMEEREKEINRVLSCIQQLPLETSVMITHRVPLGFEKENLSEYILDSMAYCARKISAVVPFDRLIVIGGETSARILRSLQVDRIEIDGQPEMGVALGRLLSGPLCGKSFAAKGGSVGTEEALLRMLQTKHPENRTQAGQR